MPINIVMKPVQILLALTFFSGMCISESGLASQRCVSECEADVASIPDIKQRQNQFKLCYKLCRMEERNPSDGHQDSSSGDKQKDGSASFLDEESDGKSDSPNVQPGQQSDNSASSGTQSAGQNSATTDENSEPVCLDNFDAEVSACESATLKAQSSCDESGSLNDKLSNLASTAAILGGQKSAMGIQESCSKMANYMKGANAALMAYRQLCNGAIAACVSACSASLTPRCNNGAASARVAGEARAAMGGNMRSCQAFSSKMAEANAALQNYALIQANAQSCAMLTTGTGTTPEICKNDPSYSGCAPQEKMDCSNPAMASNKVCICTKTPNDPVCGSGQVAREDVTPSPSTDRRTPGNQKGHIVDGDAPSEELRAPANAGGSGYSADMVDGKQGGSVSLTSPNLGPGLQKRLRDKRSSDSPVLGGFYEGGKLANEKRYEKLNLNQNGKPTEKTRAAQGGSYDNPDLEKFLPKGFNPRMPMGLAGSAGKIGIDGITGPHGSIWQKIRNRYQSIQDSLQP